MWTDEHGRALSDYPRPSLAVDVVLLSLTPRERPEQLSVLLHQASGGFADGQWLLPGAFVREDQLLSDAARDALARKGGVPGRAPEQVAVFDALDRDSRGRVVSVAHVDVLADVPLSDTTRLAPVVDGRVRVTGQRGLPYDHDAIVRTAVAWLQRRYARRADPDGLLGEEFTLSALQRVHEAVAGRALVKDTFRRRFSTYLVPTGEFTTGGVGRPAEKHRHMSRDERRAVDAEREDGRSQRRSART